MFTHKWQLSIKDVVLSLLQSRAMPVEDSAVFSERLRKSCDLGLNQILHEYRACQNLCFLDTVRHHPQQQLITISHIFWCQVEFRSGQIILSDIIPNPFQVILDQQTVHQPCDRLSIIF
jgi:hypothetical protein